MSFKSSDLANAFILGAESLWQAGTQLGWIDTYI